MILKIWVSTHQNSVLNRKELTGLIGAQFLGLALQPSVMIYTGCYCEGEVTLGHKSFVLSIRQVVLDPLKNLEACLEDLVFGLWYRSQMTTSFSRGHRSADVKWCEGTVFTCKDHHEVMNYHKFCSSNHGLVAVWTFDMRRLTEYRERFAFFGLSTCSLLSASTFPDALAMQIRKLYETMQTLVALCFLAVHSLVK